MARVESSAPRPHMKKARHASAQPGPRVRLAYLVKPQKTSRIMPRSFSVRVSPTR